MKLLVCLPLMLLTFPNLSFGQFPVARFDPWPSKNGKVEISYTMAADVKSNRQLRDAIEMALRHWSGLLGFVTFKVVPDGVPAPRDHVRFVGGPGPCAATAGYVRGQHVLHVGQCAADWRLIAHEIGHLLGLPHEHQRPAREGYIAINKFGLTELGEQQILITVDLPKLRRKRYDLLSVMHYPMAALDGMIKPNRGQWQMEVLAKGQEFLRARGKSEADVWENRNEPTDCDVAILKWVYGVGPAIAPCFGP